MPGTMLNGAGLEEGFHLAVDRPTADAQGLPNAAYTSEAYFRYERDQLFAKTWSVIGLTCDIPEAGNDFLIKKRGFHRHFSVFVV